MKPIENSSQEEQIYAPAGQSQDTQFAMKGRRPRSQQSTGMRRSLLSASLLLFAASFAGNLSAQTTLSGDHIITGDLDVGTSGTNGNLMVTGETGGAASPGIKVTGDGGVLFLGSSGTGTIPAEGAGTRMMWYPGKAAFRAGNIHSTQWDDSNIGDYSTALGKGTTASGDYSMAVGEDSVASGNYSIAMGDDNLASGWSSVALGIESVASGIASMAMGQNTTASGINSMAWGEETAASGYVSTAIGIYSIASGETSVAMGTETGAEADYSLAMGYASFAEGIASMAMGYDVVANGDYSMALGYSTDAVGDYALTMGRNTNAGGDYSAALGYYTSAAGDRATAMGGNTSAYSYISMAVGRYNVGGGSATIWQDGDPLFEIGNGTGNGADPPEVKNRNALTVYKNGDIIIPKSQGDILMGEFGNPE